MFAFIVATVIYSTTSATSDTGGSTVDSGGTVVTGSVSATSEITSTVNGGSGSSNSSGHDTVTVEATATANGETSHKAETITFSGNEPIEIVVEAVADNGTGTTSIETKASTPLVSAAPESKTSMIIEEIDIAETETTMSESADVEVTSEPKDLVDIVLQTISNSLTGFIGKIFGWWFAV